MSWRATMRGIGWRCGEAFDAALPTAEDESDLLTRAATADLVVLGIESAELVDKVRVASPAALVACVRETSGELPDRLDRFDELLTPADAGDSARLDALARIGRLRFRVRQAALSEDELGAIFAGMGLSTALVGPGGLVPPGRVPLEALHDVRMIGRHQTSICEMMGLAYATFRYASSPTPLLDESGTALSLGGTLSPYCAFLTATGEKSGHSLCAESDWAIAQAAFTALEPVESRCSGGIGLHAVPICLTFGGVRRPLAALVVATGPLPSENALIAEVSARYGVSTDVVAQMASESRFWALNPDKVPRLVETIQNLAESVSKEISHAYLTAFQAIEENVREADLRRSEEQLAEQAEQLRSANRSLEEKNQEVHDFTNSVTHDLKKPLAVIKTMLGLLRQGSLGDVVGRQREAVDTAAEAADYSIKLISDLLDSSRLEAGLTGLFLEDVELRGIVDRILGRIRFQVEEKEVDVVIGELPTVHADSDALEKVFMNLLGNAVSYIGEGERKIEISATAGPAGRVTVRVADTGLGIPADGLPHIFERFQRGTNVKGVSGTGLGLAIVKGLVEAHEGRVFVTSEVDRGTEFRFDLAAAQAPAEERLHSASHGGRYETGSESTGRPVPPAPTKDRRGEECSETRTES